MKKYLIYLQVFMFIASGVMISKAEENTGFNISADVNIKSFRDKIESEYFYGGGERDNTDFREEYELDLNITYKFSKRFSVVGSAGFIETPLKDPLINYDNDMSKFFSTMDTIYTCNGCATADHGGAPDTVDFEEPVEDFTKYNGNEHFVDGEYGNLRQFPVNINLRFDILPDSKWNPYISGGVGYLYNDFEENNTGSEYLSSLNTVSRDEWFEETVSGTGGYNLSVVDSDTGKEGVAWWDNGKWYILPLFTPDTYNSWNIEVQDSITWNLEGGFDYELNENWDFTGKIKYTWVEKRIKTTINGKEKFITVVRTDTATSAGSKNQGALATDPDNPLSGKGLGVVVAQGGTMRMDSIQAGFGFKYTF